MQSSLTVLTYLKHINRNGTYNKHSLKFDGKNISFNFKLMIVNMTTDRKLQTRLNQYLTTLGDTGIVDAESVADALRKQHPEYARRKRQPFCALISEILLAQGVDIVMSRGKRKVEDQTDILMDEHVAKKATNSTNNSLRKLYAAQSTTSTNNQKDESQTDAAIENAVQRRITTKRRATDTGGTLPGAKYLTSAIDLKVQKPDIKFADVGGLKAQLTQMCKLCLHLVHPEVFAQLNVAPPTGFLLHGPPGCGKNLLATALAGELQLPLVSIASTQLIAGVSGESENRIRELFTQVKTHAPCILLLDEVDAISPKRESAQREMERRIVAQLLTCLDELAATSSRLAAPDPSEQDQQSEHETSPNISTTKFVLVIGATSRLDAIDPALRRAGRFDHEIAIGIPTEKDRIGILQVITRNTQLADDINLKQLARNTPGYVGADLQALCREANMCCVDRLLDVNGTIETQDKIDEQELDRLLHILRNATPMSSNQLADVRVRASDFDRARQFVQPSAKREGFATVPDVGWQDIGAMHDVREQLKWSILYPIKYREHFDTFGLTTKPQGILLAGPPGCGKTLLAKAVANETGMNFISVKGPELLSMYVGESERAVRTLFQRAQNSAPCVVFFDEVDALCPKRSQSESGGSVRVVNQLLTELDGIQSRKQVFIIAATNRPDIIDPALLRPGRLDKTLYVSLPTQMDRVEIVKALTLNCTRPKFDADVDLNVLSERTQSFSGADLAALVREASVAALRERFSTINDVCETSAVVANQAVISWRHIVTALDNVKPSVSIKDKEKYDRLAS